MIDLVFGDLEVLLEAAAGELLEVVAGVGTGVHGGVEAVRGAHAVLSRAQAWRFLNMT